MNISFFAKDPWYSLSNQYLKRVSSIIRGEQIAIYLDAKLNPESGYENDVCIYVKPHIKPDEKYIFAGNKPYLDIIDGWGLVSPIKLYPDVAVIACSQRDYKTLGELIDNKLVLIPQHHCNFERIRRTREKISTVGIIGVPRAFAYLPPELKPALAERDMELIEYSTFLSRQDIVDFYKKIDIQIVWRPYKKRLANPLKLVNAASFGIPTIALREPYFEELDGYYIPITEFDELLEQLDSLRSNPSLYNDYSAKCLKKSEEYHIENIAKLYKNL